MTPIRLFTFWLGLAALDPARAHLFHPDDGTAFGAAWWTLKAS